MAVNLSKGQSVDLTKHDGGALHHVRLGLGWDAREVFKRGLFGSKRQHASVDLDASAVMLNADGSVFDTVWFHHLRSHDGSIVHTGDNLTGDGEGDDESILVDLDAVPASVEHVVFAVNSFSGDGFSEVANAFVRVVDSDAGDAELARVELTGTGSHTAIIMARLSRTGSGWSFTSLAEMANGRDVRAITSNIVDLVY